MRYQLGGEELTINNRRGVKMGLNVKTSAGFKVVSSYRSRFSCRFAIADKD